MRIRPARPMAETLEPRRLMAFSTYAQLARQDAAAIDYPRVDGRGTVVAVIDTGVDYNRAELGAGFGKGRKVVGGYDFYENDSDPMDTDGHGTQTASVVAANPYTVGGVTHRGIAPGAQILALRVGTGDDNTDANNRRALQWTIDAVKKGSYAITAVNISLGSGSYADAETDSYYGSLFTQLKDLGVLVVAASGNSNDQESGPISEDGIAYPAADPAVLAVGAVDAADVITSWTQRGDELDLLAPGTDIIVPEIEGGYTAVNGTSFSAPMVAGAAALIKQVSPRASAGDIGSILMSSGAINRDGDAESGNTTTLAFSRLDVHDAIATAVLRAGRTRTLTLGRTFDTALDSGGVLHAAFYDTANGRVLYATRSTGGLWSAAYVVDDGGAKRADVGVQLSISVDATGHVGIGYFDLTNTALKYASFDNLKWTTTTLDSAKHVGTHPSLGFDIDGNAYLAYYRRSGGDLRLATLDRDSGRWTISTLDSVGDVGAYASLDVGEAAFRSGRFTQYDTTVAVAYADSTNGAIKYWRLDLDDTAAAPFVSTVSRAKSVGGIDFNLHAGPTGLGLQAQMAFLDAAAGVVKYAYRDETWFTETVAGSGRGGGGVQITFDESNDPIVAYFQGTQRVVFTAARDGNANWSSTRVGPGSGLLSVSTNERTDTAALTYLNRARSAVFSRTLV